MHCRFQMHIAREFIPFQHCVQPCLVTDRKELRNNYVVQVTLDMLCSINQQISTLVLPNNMLMRDIEMRLLEWFHH